ncbi:hypothetical protein K488DRAFT_71294 [Vararia minispora EC-137]|uniref:Uncharacterized protein n=1 Tax=Vararia minispora EC-137 TaxID=1314806 RepID=A0ACB8QIZ5_9AGAM|nr:hypothetical protein K488DRAFT_71294 [Vararia minispora EC-137]
MLVGDSSESVEQSEPRVAHCDSLVMIDIDGFFDGRIGKDSSDRFGLIVTRPLASKRLCTEIDFATPLQVDSSDGSATPASGSHRDGMTTCFSASIYHSEPHPPTSPSAASQALLRSVPKDIEQLKVNEKLHHFSISIIPLICELKPTIPDSMRSASAHWQIRLGIVTTVKFLSVLGITDFPVFSLVVEGTIGYVVMAWGEKIERESTKLVVQRLGEDYDESKDIRVHIIERHPAAFDLRTEVGAFHYACFVAKIAHDLAPALAKKVRERREEFNARIRQGEVASPPFVWNMVQVWHERDKNEQEKKDTEDAAPSNVVTTSGEAKPATSRNSPPTSC